MPNLGYYRQKIKFKFYQTKEEKMSLKPVELHKAYRLINHGPTVMISAEFDGVRDVMSASWVCPLDYDKLTAVIGASSFTRSLFEKSGKFAVQVPFVSQAQFVAKMGTTSMRGGAGKLEGVEMFYERGVRWCGAARRFVLVSSPGGSEDSPSFYLRAKGRIERRVSELGFDRLQIVRPPLILGERPDARPLERLAVVLFKLLPACVFGKFRPLSGASSVRCERDFGSKSYKNSLIFSLYFV